MLYPLLLALAAAPPLPKECEAPVLRDVGPLKELANLDGAFSAGLDAVATWCFDSAGSWSAGILGKPARPIRPEAPPTGDCQKAISSCEGTFETVKNKAPLRELAGNALLDFDRPYRGQVYPPKRSGLKELPSEAADCRRKSRTELFAMAQQRMDLARLTSQIQNEYANYKTWLFTRGLECRNEVNAKKKDPTRAGLAIDQSVKADPVVPPTAGPPATVAAKDPELAAALTLPMLEKWKIFSKLQTKQEADRDFTLGFLASRELRGCDCTRANPAAVVRALEKKEGGEAGLSLLTSDDPVNTRCAVCMFEVFPLWSARAHKQCASVDGLTDAELLKLEKSDDVNGLPPRCLEDSKSRRAEKVRLAAEAHAKQAADAKAAADVKAAAEAKALADSRTRLPVATGRGDAGTLMAMATAPVAAPSAAVDAGTAAAAPAAGNPNLQTVDGYTYYRPNGPAAANSSAVTPVTGGTTAALGGSAAITTPVVSSTVQGGPGTEEFVPPTTWAPIPQREDGRIYVRLFRSRACVADVEPGPLQARTGDLLLLQYDAKYVQVKSPCGGLAEVYFGREARPRVSENFSRSRPLKFEFKRQ